MILLPLIEKIKNQFGEEIYFFYTGCENQKGSIILHFINIFLPSKM